MKVLIIGGTQFLGRHFVETAVAEGHTVTLFNRGRTNPSLYPEVEKLAGDRTSDLSALRGRSWDAVIDTSGFVPRVVGSSARCWRVRWGTTRSSPASPYTVTSPRLSTNRRN